MRYLFLTFGLIFFGFSCTNYSGELSARDGIMKEYFALVDSMQPGYDKTEMYMRLLKAYYDNDTAYLSRERDYLATSLQQVREFKRPGCKYPKHLSAIGFTEAYCFSHKASFCDTLINITIGKRKDTILVDLLVFKTSWDQSGKCDLVYHRRKRVDDKAWQNFQRGIAYFDFWGLNETNDHESVMDGSDLEITGYNKRYYPNYKRIHRRSPEGTGIGKLFRQVLILEGLNDNCYQFRHLEMAGEQAGVYQY